MVNYGEMKKYQCQGHQMTDKYDRMTEMADKYKSMIVKLYNQEGIIKR